MKQLPRLKITRNHNNDIVIIAHNGDSYLLTKNYEAVIESYKIAPFDFYNAFIKNGATWNVENNYYGFSNYEAAGKTVDEIESYLIMNRILE